MSARERLKAFIVQNTYSHDMPFHLLPEGGEYRHELDISDAEYPVVVDREIDAYRAEVLREAADKQRAAVNRCSRRDPVAAWRIVYEIVDLIEPDTL